VPWKRISVRLDTYSGAAVDFAAYPVDPAEVLVAGSARSRPIDTAHRTPVARWRFTPPQGLLYTPNDVDVPLQNREGFFVIEARRGDAVQQAWVDLSRVGLLTKESPGGIVLCGADLGTGRAQFVRVRTNRRPRNRALVGERTPALCAGGVGS
jgi:hypothetical protein